MIPLWLLLIPCTALRAGTPWPPSYNQIFSVTCFILGPLFKRHSSHMDRSLQLWLRERSRRCVCVSMCVCAHLCVFGFIWESAWVALLFFLLPVPFFSLLICFQPSVYYPSPHSPPVCFAPFIMFIVLIFYSSKSPVHLVQSCAHSQSPRFPFIWTVLPLWTLPPSHGVLPYEIDNPPRARGV